MLSDLMSKTSPAISVEMATLNGVRFISEQPANFAAQEVRLCEPIVCDEGSSDGTSKMVEGFAHCAKNGSAA